jgi:histidinol-phosphate aminotransferase
MKVFMLWSKSNSAVSRRSFLRLASAAAATIPIMTESRLAWAATPEDGNRPKPKASSDSAGDIQASGRVLINANENPLGPCAAACAAISAIAPKGGRYDSEGETQRLISTFATQNNLPEDHIGVYAGASEPLHFAVLAFTSVQRGYVAADPTYEAGMLAALFSRARISRVKLREDYAHDLRAMVAADPRAGLIYVCNPNNPTGTLTPGEEIEWALDHKPKGAILLVDESYIHLTDAKSVLDLVAAGKDLIVLRTFSKIYGMAGIRCGLALGRPDLLARLRPYGLNSVPITSTAAATASLLDAELVPSRRRYFEQTRKQTYAFLEQNGYKFIPSETNCFLLDTGRLGEQVIQAMQEKNIYIGRTWPIWPNMVRVSIGTPAEMERFQTAYKQVMDSPAMLASEPGQKSGWLSLLARRS